MMTHMRTITLLLAATAGFAAETVKTPIDNDQVKVLNVVVQPHEKTRLHQHKMNRVMIYLTAGRQDIDYKDTGKVVLNFKAGEMKWSPASGMHIAEITSEDPVNIIELELKKPGNGAGASASPLDPVKVDKKHYKVELENDQVRVLRVKIGPHESTPFHEHSLNRVVIYVTDQNVRATTPDGKIEILQHKAGEVSWGTPTKHKEENLADKPLEVVAVEFKS
jgi:quercetin dioxygenase-like cupin family protein